MAAYISDCLYFRFFRMQQNYFVDANEKRLGHLRIRNIDTIVISNLVLFCKRYSSFYRKCGFS